MSSPTVVYDELINDTNTPINTIDYTATAINTSLYPNSNNIAILGPVWLPRIYGKDLTAFEIASSGKIAITVNDVHSLDISQSNYIDANNYKNVITAESNFSLEFNANSGALDIFMDSYSNEIRITGASNVVLGASNGDISLVAGSNINVNGAGTISLNSTTSNVSIYAASNLSLTSSNNTIITVDGSLSNITRSNIVVKAQKGRMNLTVDSNTLNVFAYSNITLNTSNNHLVTVIGAQSNVASNISVTSSNGYNTLTIGSQSNVAGNISVISSNILDTLVLGSQSNVVAGSASITTSNDLFNTVLGSQSNIIAGYASYTTCNTSISLVIGSQYNIVGGSINVYTSNNSITTVDADSYLTSLTGSLSNVAASNIVLSAIEGTNLIESINSNVNIQASNDLSISTSNNTVITARSNFSVVSSNVNIISQVNAYVTASNNLYLSGSNDTTIAASNTLTLSATTLNMNISGDTGFSALSNIDFYISSAPFEPEVPVFSVRGNEVRLNGDLLIAGTINTSNIINTTVIQQDLKVQDRVILVAAPLGGSSNDAISFDGLATNDQSGLEIYGYPTGYNSNIISAYQKSFLWNYGNSGMDALGTSNVADEAYWEAVGGSFRLTNRKVSGSNVFDTSFSFRINELDELEIVKKFWDTNLDAYKFTRLARFGRAL